MIYGEITERIHTNDFMVYLELNEDYCVALWNIKGEKTIRYYNTARPLPEKDFTKLLTPEEVNET